MKPSVSKKSGHGLETEAGLPRLRVWGLTGGVASGKSTAARFFAEAGIPVVDADQIARSLSAAGGAAHAAIVARFGSGDRARLREIVFADPAARRDLEAILHPMIRRESLRQLRVLGEAEALRRGIAVDRVALLYEAALLVESGRAADFEGLIVITASPEVRRARLIARDRCSPEVADGILRAQLSESARTAAATHVVDNGESLTDLRQRVSELARELIAHLK